MVEVRRKRQILTCIWRNIKKGIKTINVPLRETRCNAVSNIYLLVPKTELFKKTVFYYGAILWNTSPPDVRICDTINDHCDAKPFALSPGIGLDPNATISRWGYQHVSI